ncbi:MAG TPA: dihydrofolate reductase family protein [Solirubrobacterales bacterium]|nr:dihydrofolate reductase family protein [Solirubrobacterales bacterium]
MAALVYSAIASLDGYVADRGGDFGWAAPDEEVHSFVNELERPIGTYLFGRRMYEVMEVWESDEILDGQPPCMREYAEIWRAAEKVVYSTRLQAVATGRTRLEREFDPAAIREMKDSAPHDISIGGPALAGQALAAGLVDECHLLLNPVVVGGGKSAFPINGQIDLELLDQRRFGNGTVYLHYRLGG